MQNFFMILKSFIVGGIICIIGQVLIDKTKLTPARILVLFVTLGAVLGGLGIYKHLISFAGAGATAQIRLHLRALPLPGQRHGKRHHGQRP